MPSSRRRPCGTPGRCDVDALTRLRLTRAERDGTPWADEIERLPGVTVEQAVNDLLATLPNCYASTTDAELASALLDAGAVHVRHARQMRLRLPLDGHVDDDVLAFTADARPPVPWSEVLPAFLAAYPAEHVDHLPGDEDLVDSYLIPYTEGARLGPLISHASGIAVRGGRSCAGILVVDRPGEGPWVCDIWRDPSPEYAGTGTSLLRWSASRLQDHASLGLVVTVGNTAAERAYERVGFATESTAWTVRLPPDAD